MERTVMVIEDDPLIALDLAQTLKRAGWVVVGTVPTGEAAVQAFADGARPCLAILDINLGRGIDGIATAERIREHDPRVIMLFHTAHTDAETRARAERVQPFALVEKGTGSRRLLALLEELCREHEQAPPERYAAD